MIDILSFLRQYNIPFAEHGQVSKGNVGVACPFCGDDGGHHLGISLTTGYWNCWRNSAHRGRRLAPLVARMIGCSIQEAERIVQEGDLPSRTPLSEIAKILEDMPDEPPQILPAGITWPGSFKPPEPRGYRARFWDYLARTRGFGDDVKDLVAQYDLRCGLTDKWMNRILVPIRSSGQVRAFTGRAIDRGSLRYLSEPPGRAVKQLVWNFDECLLGGRRLYVCEGPFDALKMDFYGAPHGARATCLFSSAATPEQRGLLMDLMTQFKETVILLDSTALADAMRLQSQLAGSTLGWLPAGKKDPGMLDGRCIKKMVQIDVGMI